MSVSNIFDSIIHKCSCLGFLRFSQHMVWSEIELAEGICWALDAYGKYPFYMA